MGTKRGNVNIWEGREPEKREVGHARVCICNNSHFARVIALEGNKGGKFDTNEKMKQACPEHRKGLYCHCLIIISSVVALHIKPAGSKTDRPSNGATKKNGKGHSHNRTQQSNKLYGRPDRRPVKVSLSLLFCSAPKAAPPPPQPPNGWTAAEERRPILIDRRENGQDTADAIRENAHAVTHTRRTRQERGTVGRTTHACAHGQPTDDRVHTRYTLHVWRPTISIWRMLTFRAAEQEQTDRTSDCLTLTEAENAPSERAEGAPPGLHSVFLFERVHHYGF